MPNSIRVVNGVDLKKYPEQNPWPDCSEITIGDIHGNAVKLVHLLQLHGIIDIKEKKYHKLVSIYEKDVNDLEESDIDEFNKIIEEDIVVKDKKTIFRIIGDDLADRGNNDYFTIKLLEKLSTKKAKVEILLSNHGIEFLNCIENNTDFKSTVSPSTSLKNLQELINKNLINRETIDEITETHYKPMLKLISYTLEKKNNSISIYSHAPIGRDEIRSAAKKLNVRFKDSNIDELAKTIDRINEKFNDLLKNNKVNKLYPLQLNAYIYTNTNLCH